MQTKVFAAVLSLVFATAASANDSTAELTTGGLRLVNTAQIAMQSEDLFVSTDSIRVHYRFKNTSDKDVTTLVAFPMPDITIEGIDDTIAIPTENPENILGFSITVDGKPVTAQVQQRVTAYGIDRTDDLRKLGVPLAPHVAASSEALNKLPQEKWGELVSVGLALVDESDAGDGSRKHLIPTWTLKTTYYWFQQFPAGKTLEVEHAYKPSVGSSAMTDLGESYAIKEPYYAKFLQKYCIEPSLVAAYQKLRREHGWRSDNGYAEQRISYILTTGANWAGPIGQFRLVVDKGDPKNLVSFCGDGVKKISPTQFEIQHTDFTPDRDLDIVLLVPRAD